jgi:hypothetical protein
MNTCNPPIRSILDDIPIAMISRLTGQLTSTRPQNQGRVKSPARQAAEFSSAAFLLFKLATVIWIAVLVQVMPVSGALKGMGYDTLPGYIHMDQVGDRLLIAPWYRWDSVHYLNIATLGYGNDLNDTVWPPLYPGLIWMLSRVIPNPLTAALILSNLACWMAFYLLYRLVDRDWGANIARKTVFLVCIFPTAFFLLAGYTESLFLALAVGAMWMARERRWLWAGLLAALAALARTQGFILLVPLAWEWWTAYRGGGRNLRQSAASLIPFSFPVIATAGYFAYVHWIAGGPWYWESASEVWQEVFRWPWQGIFGNIQALWQGVSGGQVPLGTTLYDLVIALLVIGLTAAGWKRIPISYSLYSVAVFLPSLMKVTTGNLLVSITRYAIVLFPIFIVLALVMKRKITSLAWFGVCVGSQALFMAIFYLAFWVG